MSTPEPEASALLAAVVRELAVAQQSVRNALSAERSRYRSFELVSAYAAIDRALEVASGSGSGSGCDAAATAEGGPGAGQPATA
jgi:hypothetical protein